MANFFENFIVASSILIKTNKLKKCFGQGIHNLKSGKNPLSSTFTIVSRFLSLNIQCLSNKIESLQFEIKKGKYRIVCMPHRTLDDKSPTDSYIANETCINLVFD
ncbi:hypothetical protein HHI36_016080 [Cryptolaemus montrouzieri]|uniref:Uncharacterized protein n=1 Tax=Cryptolaemus montrouzieri TaxID=559131 RepID=A0ABD2N7Q1_9CUCU